MPIRRKKRKVTNAELAIQESSHGVLVRVFSYTGEHVFENNFTDFASLKNYLEKNEEAEHWIDIVGKTNKEFFGELGQYFNLHELVLEDILSIEQRSKVDDLGEGLLIISRMIYFDKSGQLINEQVSFLIFSKVLITVQDEWDDSFEQTRVSLRKNRLTFKNEASFHLAMLLLGNIIDQYFPMLDEIADRLDLLEETLIQDPTEETSSKIQDLKRTLIFLRKYIRPERDVINRLLILEHERIKESSKIYLRDIYDHCVQVNDTIDSYREIAYSLMDVYLSSIGNRTNITMKVLTVISAIFIPLTFIAGVYGMNFDNMPELRFQNGYYAIIGVMLLVALIQILYFKKKKWL